MQGMGTASQGVPIQVRMPAEQKLDVAKPGQPVKTVAGGVYGEIKHLVFRRQDVRNSSQRRTMAAGTRQEFFRSDLDSEAIGEPKMQFDDGRAGPSENDVIMILAEKACLRL